MTALVGDVREITITEAPAVSEPVVSVDEGGGNERTRNLTGSIASIVRIVATAAIEIVVTAAAVEFIVPLAAPDFIIATAA